jgi:polysaccharide chain length determinant protein (PEP-CTERM system associated)
MIPKDGINIQYVKGAVERRFWYIVLPFFMLSLATIVYCIVTPRSFRAQTVILVEPQKVPGAYVSSTVTVDLTARLRTITQQIKSRTRLEELIEKYDLYADIRADATMTDAVRAFRNDIEINVRGGRHAFEVAFRGKDRVKVKDVTDTIANLFIEDNLKLREAQAAGTTRFLDREIERLQGALRQKETALREFKEKYMGFLPENMGQNTAMLSHLQRQLDTVNASIEQIKDRKVLLETQLKNLERMEAQFGSFDTGGGDLQETAGLDINTTETWTSPAVDDLRDRLKNLRSRYSDKHPDVTRLQAVIAKLEEEQAASASNADSGVLGDDIDSSGSADSQGLSLFAAQKEDLVARLDIVKSEIADAQQEEKKIKEEMEIYRHRIENGPKIEQMAVDLERGYGEISRNYASLLQKKFNAQVAENLERAQKGEQFTILDPAKLPDKPYAPRTRKVLLLGFFLSLAVGLSLAFLREYTDPSFLSAKELESSVEMPVLVSIPVIMTDQDHRNALIRKALFTATTVSMAAILLYGLYFLWKMDPMAMA